MLIVNADDYGYDEPTSAAILECFAAGRLTSATLMVHMADSERAAGVAAEAGLPLGLHVNLTEAITDPGAPAEVRERQQDVARRLRRPGASRFYDPFARAAVTDAVADQLGEFRRLTGGEPTHADGHLHVQEWPNVIVSPALREVARLRPTYTFDPGEKGRVNRALRAGLNRLIRRRFTAPRWFFDVRDLHPALGGRDGRAKLARARADAVEVMTHPGWADEREFLMSPEWRALIDGHTLGTYADL